MIDYASGIVVYDQLVKPLKPIQDYLTRYVHSLMLPPSAVLILFGQDGRA